MQTETEQGKLLNSTHTLYNITVVFGLERKGKQNSRMDGWMLDLII